MLSLSLSATICVHQASVPLFIVICNSLCGSTDVSLHSPNVYAYFRCEMWDVRLQVAPADNGLSSGHLIRSGSRCYATDASMSYDAHSVIYVPHLNNTTSYLTFHWLNIYLNFTTRHSWKAAIVGGRKYTPNMSETSNMCSQGRVNIFPTKGSGETYLMIFIRSIFIILHARNPIS